jgi:hypothetical protein
VSTVSRAVALLRRAVHELDAECVAPRDAVDLLSLFAEGERLCAAGKTLVVRRVDESGIWKHEGHRSAAHLVAATSGTSIGQAQQVVDTARRLSGLSRTEDELRAGRLSSAQAHEVTSAAAESPAHERELLARKDSDGLQGLKAFGAQVKAAASSEEAREERERRIHRGRYVRHWIDPDGAGRGEWRLTPAAHARVVARLRGEHERIFRERRRTGDREPAQAYAADALMALVDGDATTAAPGTTVLIRVDAERLQRHGDDDDGVCEIAGVGPVPVSVARAALGNDAMVKLVVTKGVDVLNVTHIGRTRTAAVQTALDWLYDECGIVDCHSRVAIEQHHTEPYRKTGHTRLRELAPLCRFHHRRVERDGCTLARRADGEYDLIEPGDLIEPVDRAPP